ncbi:MAG: PLP-dependent aminotransferase family protein [Gemmataceae bacterium]
MSRPPVKLSHRCSDASQPISYFMKQAVENPDLITLAAGLVDPSSLPVGPVTAALDRLLGETATAQAALQYGTTQGYAALREMLLHRTTALDGRTPDQLGLTVDNVVITTGSQQLLYLLTEMLCDPGDLVITETPTYFVFLGLAQTLGVRTVGVPMDDDGMRIDALEATLSRLERTGQLDRLRFIYTCDYFQNPSGLTLSAPRRQRLLELARQYSRGQRLLIVEDAAYRELRYDGPDVPSIKSLDTDNSQVVLAMSFSKSLAPGLKTGYGLMPRELVEAVAGVKGSHDFGSNNLAQHLIARLIETGAYDEHVGRVRALYQRKRDVLLAALTEAFPAGSGVRWTRPGGGLYVWLSFADGVDTGPDGTLLKAALREGVLYVPGAFCCPPGEDSQRNAIRLCFAPVPIEQIGEAVRRLARAAASA